MQKRLFTVLLITAALLILSSCGKKQGGDASFSSLKSGMDVEELTALLGNEYEATTAPARMIFKNVSLFDSTVNEKDTKLSCFLADDGKCYLYAYYIYSAEESDYDSLYKYFCEKYGEAGEAEADKTSEKSAQWSDGERNISLSKTASYIAVGLF